ncbi:unnamed protein product [Musa acuminata var. zebrina]
MVSVEAFRVLEQSQVSPPNGSAPPASIPLSFFDIVMSPAGPVRRIFFYDFPHPTAVVVDSVLPRLRSSLSLALQRFYPLAGNLMCSSSPDDRSGIGCADGDSVSFVVVECVGVDFRELSGTRAHSVAELQLLAPRLVWSGAAKPLLAVQVTVFPNHGFAVGASVPHAACDGSSYVHFMNAWASACRTGQLAEPAQSFDRTAVPNPLQLRSVNIFPGFDRCGTDESPTLASDFVSATFCLTQDQLQRLKRSVTAKFDERHGSFHCSTAVVTYAYAWICLVKTFGYAGDKIAHLIFLADYRGRLQPPLPMSYFGNCIVPCFVEVKVSDLVGEDGIVVAAEAIGKAIQGLRDGAALEGVHEWGGRWQFAATQQAMTVAGSSRFRVYDADFGWGRPVKVEMVIQRAGALSLAESRSGDGVEIGLSFDRTEMDLFERHFSAGLKLLSE